MMQPHLLRYPWSSQSATGLGTEIASLVPLRDTITFRSKHCFVIFHRSAVWSDSVASWKKAGLIIKGAVLNA